MAVRFQCGEFLDAFTLDHLGDGVSDFGRTHFRADRGADRGADGRVHGEPTVDPTAEPTTEPTVEHSAESTMASVRRVDGVEVECDHEERAVHQFLSTQMYPINRMRSVVVQTLLRDGRRPRWPEYLCPLGVLLWSKLLRWSLLHGNFLWS